MKHDEKCERRAFEVPGAGAIHTNCGCARRAYLADPFPEEDMPLTVEPVLTEPYPTGISWGEARARAVEFLGALNTAPPVEDESVFRSEW